MKVLLNEAIKCTEEERYLAVNLETAKWELADAEKEIKWLRSALSSSEKEYEQIQQDIEDAQIELDSERWSSSILEIDFVSVPRVNYVASYLIITCIMSLSDLSI